MYLLPLREDRDFISRTAMQLHAINADLLAAKPKSVNIFMDTCFSGQNRSGESLVAGSRPDHWIFGGPLKRFDSPNRNQNAIIPAIIAIVRYKNHYRLAAACLRTPKALHRAPQARRQPALARYSRKPAQHPTSPRGWSRH